MIKIDNVSTYGWQEAIRGMRNPMNSWAKSDSSVDENGIYTIGEADKDLMHRLARGGSDDRKFMRFIIIYMDIYAPLYWWKQFDTYKIGTVSNSCSTMHKIASREFDIDDFSYEHLNECNKHVLSNTIIALNDSRETYLESGKLKENWWQLIQLLPSSYNQKRTCMLNYEVARNMYQARKNHKLDEWHVFCDCLSTLTMSELITTEGL